MNPQPLSHSADASLAAVCDGLARWSAADQVALDWPDKPLQLCAEAGVFTWFVPTAEGGQGWSSAQITQGYLRLSQACLTTTFVLTQLTGALRRIAAMENDKLRARLLPGLLTGEASATLGISHLTTSRRHLQQPVLRAELTDQEVVLNGFSPWVTGGGKTDYLVTGAVLPDQRQLLILVPSDQAGVAPQQPARLLALNGSCTGAVQFDNVRLSREWLLCEPAANVMQLGVGGRTGGLQTSTLALGLAKSGIDYLHQQAVQRPELLHPADQLATKWSATTEQLLGLAAATEVAPSAASQLRAEANSLVLRAAQAALVAAKGAGFIDGHPAGRWCREALFFLVWSCPQPVLEANLCELAGLQLD